MTSPTSSGNEAHPSLALIAAFSAATIVSLLGGLTWPLLSLRLAAMGYQGGDIGLSTAAQMASIVLIAPLVAPCAARIGPVRLMLLAVAAAVVVVLGMAAWESYGAWLVLRFLLGVCFEILFILTDVWVVQLAPPAKRGRVLGLFTSISIAGYAVGPLVIDAVGFEGWPPFVAGAVAISLAAIPLWLARHGGPRAEGRRSSSFLGYLRRTPTIMLAGAMYGFIDLIELSLFPVYALRSGMDEGSIARLLSMAIFGSIAIQLGIGWLADRVAPRRMLVLCTLMALACAVVLPFAIISWTATMVLMLFWSGSIGGFFTVGMIMMGHRYQGIDLIAGNSVFVVMFGVGSMVGPLVGGGAMDVWDPHGMVAVIAVACAAFLLLVVFGPDRSKAGA